MPISVATDDVLELTMKGAFGGISQVINVYHYKVTAAGSATLQEFGAGLAQMWAAVIGLITNEHVKFNEVEVTKLDTDGLPVTGESFIAVGDYLLGQQLGESLPPFVCWTFKYLRPNATFRHGFKRFAGVDEDAQLDGFPASSIATPLANVAAALEGTLHAYTIDTDGNPDTSISGATAVPVILQKIINGDPISPINVGLVSDVVFDRIGTQNSRKYGVGS